MRTHLPVSVRCLPLLYVLIALLAGCSTLGPTETVKGPVALNKAIAEIPENQLLDVWIELFDPGELPGVDSRVGDIRDAAAVLEACRGVDVVLHAAAQIDWGHATPEELAEVNVGGTENVLRACRETGVRGLVYTSSMDAVSS